MYKIGEMAQLLGIAPSTLRYYDKEGLLPFLEKNENGTRMFKESDYEFLKIIDCLKASGMQIKDIRSFINMTMQGDETIDSRLELFLKRREEILKQMAQLQETLDTVNFKCWYYETAKKAGSTQVPANMPLEQLPPQFRGVRCKLRKERLSSD